MSDDPSGTPVEEPDLLRQLREEHRWTLPNPTDAAVMLAACRCWFDDFVVIATKCARTAS